MVYELHYVGGPEDGTVALSPRPYDSTRSQGHVYRAECEGDECLEWVDDDTRRITLHYVGKGVKFPPVFN